MVKISVVGGGMTAQRFVEKLFKYKADIDNCPEFEITIFTAEKFAPYDRVNLTKYASSLDSESLLLAGSNFYEDNNVKLLCEEKVTSVDEKAGTLGTEKGNVYQYDILVLATGSSPFIPDIPGKDAQGVFVYRTIEDIDSILAYQTECNVKSCAVIGGGLLGLESAKVCLDVGCEDVTVLQKYTLMNAQLDKIGGEELKKKVEEFGCKVICNAQTEAINVDFRGSAMSINISGCDTPVPAQLVIIAAGVRPCDELGRQLDLKVHERGGIIVDDLMATSKENIYAIGECTRHNGCFYGLVGPCYDQADTLARRLCYHPKQKPFTAGDMSTKLKLAGVDVASFGTYSVDTEDLPGTRSMVFHDPFGGIYRRLVFNEKGTLLLGGMLFGDAGDYGTLAIKAKSGKPLAVSPAELLPPPSLKGASSSAGDAIGDIDDEAQICSCNDVSKGEISAAVKEKSCCSMEQVMKCTNAGTGCGACKPMVKDIMEHDMKTLGMAVTNYVCEHFNYSRAELYHIAKIKKLRYYDDIFAEAGNPAGSCAGQGCEICKPTVASIMASLWNEHILNPKLAPLQDTNDRFLANIQRGGTYSVVPRVPGGEITPEKLAIIAAVAQKYGLYTKITGGQRIDMFGAPKENLPDIWKELVDAGFESGHAYGKSLRTVKSCVGSSWCRYGMRDSVDFAIKVENRYRGIRSPHKLKGGVSGCKRECAEAQGKDFGLIATENGYNIYLCGNGGTAPKHAELFASDVPEDLCIKYLDRFLIFYIETADRLQRTARWLEKLEGGMDYLRDVIIKDKLGICNELEKQMKYLVNTYECEWAKVVKTPELQKQFRQGIDTRKNNKTMNQVEESKAEKLTKKNMDYYGIEFVDERGQQRPAYWPNNQATYKKLEINIDEQLVPRKSFIGAPVTVDDVESKQFDGASWTKVCTVADVPENCGSTIKYGKVQIAVFNDTVRGKWYATQNMCPHRNAFVLSQGIIGDASGVPKVSCPLHKKPFDLSTGKSIDQTTTSILTFPVKIVKENVFLKLPTSQILDDILATDKFVVKAGDAEKEAELGSCGSCQDEKLVW